MSFRTKASLASFFETGDKPVQAQFQDLIDTLVAIPSGASFPSVIEVESTASSTSRRVGSVGARVIEASATSQLTNMLDVPASVAHSTFGIALVSAANTAAAQNILGIVSAGSFGTTFMGTGTTAAAQSQLGIVSAGAVGTNLIGAGTTVAAQQQLDLNRDSISGMILGPVARRYKIEQRARFAYNVEWIAAQASAGHCQITLLSDTSIMTGLASAGIDVTEVATSASVSQSIQVGETLVLQVSDVSAASALSFTIGITRT